MSWQEADRRGEGCAGVGEEIREFKTQGRYTDPGQEGKVEVSYNDA